ncbi:LuxR C-terminal-related transcriptional regulator [Lacticaseibacillus parakribbianus]|uniref:LuxR C-terminal-related transcriptional regulator n=1 Tax=Lacticaseibacillus parakribbianus TaxID=2970927 RepID=UPI0021CB8AEA|nr:LuxR C-terminal-related transcriptional regulator [Lacticaseibacillus parakribbianus]
MTLDIDSLLRDYDPLIRRVATHAGDFDQFYGEALELAWHFIATEYPAYQSRGASDDFAHLLAWRLKRSLATLARNRRTGQRRQDRVARVLQEAVREPPPAAQPIEPLLVTEALVGLWPRLTASERRVLNLAYQGATNAAIARELGLSHQRVTQLRAAIRKKFLAANNDSGPNR